MEKLFLEAYRVKSETLHGRCEVHRRGNKVGRGVENEVKYIACMMYEGLMRNAVRCASKSGDVFRGRARG